MSCNSMEASLPSTGPADPETQAGCLWVMGERGEDSTGLGGSHTWDCKDRTPEARWTSWLVQGLYHVRNGRLRVRERHSLQSYKGKFCPA